MTGRPDKSCCSEWKLIENICQWQGMYDCGGTVIQHLSHEVKNEWCASRYDCKVGQADMLPSIVWNMIVCD